MSPSLQEMWPGKLPARSAITMRRIIVEPIYENDRRIGSRVWDDGVEMDEHDPRFRVGCVRSSGREPSWRSMTGTRGISGGAAILRRVVPTSSLALKGDRDDFVAEGAAVERVAEGRDAKRAAR